MITGVVFGHPSNNKIASGREVIPFTAIMRTHGISHKETTEGIQYTDRWKETKTTPPHLPMGRPEPAHQQQPIELVLSSPAHVCNCI
jgi:hypothetical protein